MTTSHDVNAQSVKASFLMNVLPDNWWYLELSKNDTYVLKHVGSWSGTNILDEGQYTYDGQILNLESKSNQNVEKEELPRSHGFKLDTLYYLTEIKLKKGEELQYIRSCKKSSLFGNKYLVLTYEALDEKNLIKCPF